MNQRSRRNVIWNSIASLVLVTAGCMGSDDTPQHYNRTNLTEDTDENEVSTDVNNDSVTMLHPFRIHADESPELTVSNVPTNRTLELICEEDGFESRILFESSDEKIKVNNINDIRGDIPTDISVPITGALFQFLPKHTRPANPIQSVNYRLEADGETVGSTNLIKEYPYSFVNDNQKFTDIEADDLVGKYILPQTNEAGPAIIIPSITHPKYTEAELLARHGFFVVVVQCLGRQESIPSNLVEFPIEYIKNAIDWLQTRDHVAADRFGIFGTYKSGELSLLAAQEYDQIDVVVSRSGSAIVWEGMVRGDESAGTSSWSIQGDPVPWVPHNSSELGPFPSDSREIYSDAFHSASSETKVDAMIDLDTIEGSILLLSSGMDEVWDSKTFYEIVLEEIPTTGHTIEHITFSDAGHYYPPPYLPMEMSPSTYGGTLRGNAEASHEYWEEILTTFNELKTM